MTGDQEQYQLHRLKTFLLRKISTKIKQIIIKSQKRYHSQHGYIENFETGEGPIEKSSCQWIIFSSLLKWYMGDYHSNLPGWCLKLCQTGYRCFDVGAIQFWKWGSGPLTPGSATGQYSCSRSEWNCILSLWTTSAVIAYWLGKGSYCLLNIGQVFTWRNTMWR